MTTPTRPSDDIPIDRDALFAYLENGKGTPILHSSSETFRNSSSHLTLAQALDHPVSEDILYPSYYQESCSAATAFLPFARAQEELVPISYLEILDPHRDYKNTPSRNSNTADQDTISGSHTSEPPSGCFVSQPLHELVTSALKSEEVPGHIASDHNADDDPIPSSNLSSQEQHEANKTSQEQHEANKMLVAHNQESADDFSSSQLHKYDEEKWNEYLRQLLSFKSKLGHCCVPYKYKLNPALSRWVRRQRYQYKLKIEGRPGGITESRVAILEKAGFVWNAHGQKWQNRWNELMAYCFENGHGNVPHNYRQNPELANWVKNQRRQHKLFQEGKPSNITRERIDDLNSLGFTWEH